MATEITGVTTVKGKGSIALVRVGPTKPEHCIHGETICVLCGKAVWLGDKTLELVMDGATPVCTVCVQRLADSGQLTPEHRLGNIGDHRRADGPH